MLFTIYQVEAGVARRSAARVRVRSAAPAALQAGKALLKAAAHRRRQQRAGIAASPQAMRLLGNVRDVEHGHAAAQLPQPAQLGAAATRVDRRVGGRRATGVRIS